METINLLSAGIRLTICSRDRLSRASIRYNYSQALTILRCHLQSLLLITIHQNYMQNMASRIHVDSTQCMPRMTNSECMYNVPFLQFIYCVFKTLW